MWVTDADGEVIRYDSELDAIVAASIWRKATALPYGDGWAVWVDYPDEGADSGLVLKQETRENEVRWADTGELHYAETQTRFVTEWR